jgi:hypothetical protein
MKMESNNIATNNQVFVVCATQTLNSHQTENCTFGIPPVQSDKLCQIFTSLDRLILQGEKSTKRTGIFMYYMET